MKGLSQNRKAELCVAPGLGKPAQHLSQSGVCLRAGCGRPPRVNGGARSISDAERAPDLPTGARPRQRNPPALSLWTSFQMGSQWVTFCRGTCVPRLRDCDWETTAVTKQWPGIRRLPRAFPPSAKLIAVPLRNIWPAFQQ